MVIEDDDASFCEHCHHWSIFRLYIFVNLYLHLCCIYNVNDWPIQYAMLYDSFVPLEETVMWWWPWARATLPARPPLTSQTVTRHAPAAAAAPASLWQRARRRRRRWGARRLVTAAWRGACGAPRTFPRPEPPVWWRTTAAPRWPVAVTYTRRVVSSRPYSYGSAETRGRHIVRKRAVTRSLKLMYTQIYNKLRIQQHGL